MSSPSPGSTSGPESAAAVRQVPVARTMWSYEEDRALREQVRRHGGPHSWDAICAALPGRTAKSCRLRWYQHLDPRVDGGGARAFTHREDMLIVRYQAAYGNRWSTIAEFLSGRTDNAVKNRWNSVLRKRYGHPADSSASDPHPRRYGPPPSASAAPHAAEVTPGFIPLFPPENGDVRRSPALPHAPEDDVSSEDEACAAPMDCCLPLFPLAPGDTRAAAASSDMSCGADDPLTLLSLAPAAPRMVFDVLPLRAYRM